MTTIPKFAIDNLKYFVLLCFVLLILTYSSTMFLPYMLLDESWILRGLDHQAEFTYPSLKYVVFLQGRPFFEFLLYLSMKLAHISSQGSTMIVLRGIAIIGLTIFATQLFSICRKIKIELCLSFIISIVAVTLPSFQVIVSDGPWLVFPTIFVTASFVMCYNSIKFDLKATYGSVIISIFLCLLALATYQSLIALYFSLLIFTILFDFSQLNKILMMRLILRSIFILGISIALYYLMWKISCKIFMPGIIDSRYSPQTVHLNNFFDNFNHFVDFRIFQAMNFWFFIVNSKFYCISSMLILLGFITKFIMLLRVDCVGIVHSTKIIILLVSTCLLTCILSDAIAMASPKAINSYTTLTALSVSFYFILIWSILNIFNFIAFGVGTKIVNLFKSWILIIASISLLLFTQYSVLMYFSLPGWTSSNLVMDTLQNVIRNGDEIKEVLVYESDRPFDYLYSDTSSGFFVEFYWFNFGSPMYTYWQLRNVLDHLNIKYIPDITFLYNNSAMKPVRIMGNRSSNKGKTIIIDFRKDSLVKSLIKD